VITFTAQMLNTQGRSPHYPLNRRLSGLYMDILKKRKMFGPY
jgi:hypothetical protein